MRARRQWLSRTLLAIGLWYSPGTNWAQLESALRGHVIDPMECADDPTQTYALYLPSYYTTDRRWPIIYCFDPIARGRVAVERFRAAAERRGYILIGSNNSKNGPIAPTFAAANALLTDTQRRFTLDHARFYVAGFSGGARAACAIAGAGKFAGVIACSGGFPGDSIPPEVPFVFFGTAGRRDFNFAEMVRLGPELERRKTPHRLVILEGGHEWLPESFADEALAWLDLQAVRRGLTSRNEDTIREQFRTRTAAAAAMVGPADERCSAYRSVLADFDGLVDTSEVAVRVAALEKSREFRHALAARDRAIRDEEAWREALTNALQRIGQDDETERPDPFAGTPGPEIPSSDNRENYDPDAERRTASVWRPFRSGVSLRAREDAFITVRRVAGDLQRRSPKNAAAARALGGVFLTCLSDGALLYEQGKYEAAARAYEAASILRPDASSSYFEWARARAAVGDKRRARELLETATAKGFEDGARVDALRIQLGLPPLMSAAPLAAAPRNAPVVAPVAPAPAASADTAPTSENQPAIASGVVRGAAPARDAAPGMETVGRAPRAILRDSDVVSLDTVRVSGRPIGSFGISLKIFAVPGTKQINRIVVYEVAPESDAAANHVNPGDEIIRVNGRSIYSFVVAFDRDSEFGRLFVGRKRGDEITLDLLTPSGTERRVTLTEGLGNTRPPWLR